MLNAVRDSTRLVRYVPSLVPRPSAGGGKAWYTLFAHAQKFPDIPVIQTRKVYASATELKFDTCANSVYQAFPPPAEGLGTRLGMYTLHVHAYMYMIE